MEQGTRACRTCSRTLPLTDFYRDGRSPGGYRTACKRCHIAAVLQRPQANAEANAQYQAAYRATHREEARQRTARYRAENPERVRAVQVAYRADPVNQQVARDRARAFRLANPDRRTEYQRRRRAAKISHSVGFITPEMLTAKIAYWAGLCWICSAAWEQIDHVKPLSKGGAHMLANLRPICALCNGRKANHWPYARR